MEREEISRVLSCAAHFDKSLQSWEGRHQPLVARLIETAAPKNIGRPTRTRKPGNERFGPSLADSHCSRSIVGDMVAVFALIAHVNRPGAARKDQAACTAPGACAAPEGPACRTLCASWCIELHHFLACAGRGPHCGDFASETCGASCAMKGIGLMQTPRCSTAHKITGKPCG